MSKKTKKDDVIKRVQNNHIWLNAFNCINPTDEFCKRLGKTIIDHLNSEERLIDTYIDDNDEYLNDTEKFIAEQQTLYLSINKS